MTRSGRGSSYQNRRRENGTADWASLPAAIAGEMQDLSALVVDANSTVLRLSPAVRNGEQPFKR
jgi:hypothetical protein